MGPSQRSLTQWDSLLSSHPEFQIQPRHVSALCPLWSDKSGEDTCGTREVLSFTTSKKDEITPFEGGWSLEVYSFPPTGKNSRLS